MSAHKDQKTNHPSHKQQPKDGAKKDLACNAKEKCCSKNCDCNDCKDCE